MKNCGISLLSLLSQIAGTQLGAVLTSIHYLCFWEVKRKVVNAPVNYTVCMSVRPYRKVCITHNSETGCTIDLKLYRYVA